MKSDGGPRNYRKDTLLTHVGRNPEANSAASTRPSIMPRRSSRKTWPSGRRNARRRPYRVRYGLHGTPGTFALEELLARIEGGYRAMLMSSGLAAVTAPLQACLGCGDHCLMVDSGYGPARNFCEGS